MHNVRMLHIPVHCLYESVRFLVLLVRVAFYAQYVHFLSINHLCFYLQI